MCPLLGQGMSSPETKGFVTKLLDKLGSTWILRITLHFILLVRQRSKVFTIAGYSCATGSSICSSMVFFHISHIPTCTFFTCSPRLQLSVSLLPLLAANCFDVPQKQQLAFPHHSCVGGVSLTVQSKSWCRVGARNKGGVANVRFNNGCLWQLKPLRTQSFCSFQEGNPNHPKSVMDNWIVLTISNSLIFFISISYDSFTRFSLPGKLPKWRISKSKNTLPRLAVMRHTHKPLTRKLD